MARNVTAWRSTAARQLRRLAAAALAVLTAVPQRVARDALTSQRLAAQAARGGGGRGGQQLESATSAACVVTLALHHGRDGGDGGQAAAWRRATILSP